MQIGGGLIGLVIVEFLLNKVGMTILPSSDKIKNILEDNKRIPRKKGQHRGSSSHSDLYTDENPKGTIKGLKFETQLMMFRNQ